MSDFLELCQQTRSLCRIPGSGPTTVVGQTGQLERIVNAVASSWTALQNEQTNWRWMRSEFSVPTVASVESYAYNAAGMVDSVASSAIVRFGRWWTEEMQIYLASAGIGTRHPLQYLPWAMWRAVWKVGSILPAYPSQGTIDPRNNLRLGAMPDNFYTFTGEYQKSAQVLALDADVPEMPPQFHELIVARAAKRYAGASAAPEIWTLASDIEDQLLPSLVADQLPEPRFGAPLA